MRIRLSRSRRSSQAIFEGALSSVGPALVSREETDWRTNRIGWPRRIGSGILAPLFHVFGHDNAPVRPGRSFGDAFKELTEGSSLTLRHLGMRYEIH